MRLIIHGFLEFLIGIWHERKILWGLARNDLKGRFAASMLGGIWAFVQPLVTMLVMWFVFQVGFRNPPVNDVPFIVWLAPAFLVWTFFAETIFSGTNCMIEYNYLVKKINFRVSMIPLVKIISSAFIHIAFIGFIFFLLIACDVPLSIYNLQVIYYFLCTCFLLTGLCWLLSAIAPFVKDVVNVVGVVTQIGVWATPIFWNPDNMNPWVQNILRFNPMFYICRGYRDSFIDHVWFWERFDMAGIFWGIAIACFIIGALLFKRMRPQFADVL